MRLWKSLSLTLLATALLFRMAPVARAAEEAPAYIGIHCPLTATAMIVVPLDKNLVSQGSGFVIDKANRLLVTNRHVVAEKDAVSVIFPVYENGQARADRAFYLRKAPAVKGRVIDRDASHDLAVIEVESLPEGTPELKLATDSGQCGSRIHASGNPGNDSHAFVYTVGKVRNVKAQNLVYDNEQKVSARILEIETDHKMAKGVSGGPVVNDDGELLGVVSATPPDGSLTALCIDIREVRGFLGQAMRKRATALLQKQEYEKAVTSCDLAVKYNPKDALSYNERGAAYSFLDQYDKAAENYSSAIKLDPSLACAWRNRGSMNFYRGDYEKAVADCNEAIKLDKKFALAYLTRSKAKAKLARADEARDDYDMARKLDPSLK